MGFIALRRNYQDSYLEEIGQQGSNGFLVRRASGDEANAENQTLAQANLTIEMRFPEITQIALPWFFAHYARPNDYSIDDVIVKYQGYTLVPTSGSDPVITSTCYYFDPYWDGISDCSQPEPLRARTPEVFWSSREDEYPTIILGLNRGWNLGYSLFKPYWGTLGGEMPVIDYNSGSHVTLASEAQEGQWMLALNIRWSTPYTTQPQPTPPEDYFRVITHPRFMCWLYSKKQHRLELNKPLEFVFSFSDSSELPKTSVKQFIYDDRISDFPIYEREVKNCLTSIFEGKKITVTLKEAKTRTVNETSA